jgi:Tol biopolymer transport system component
MTVDLRTQTRDLFTEIDRHQQPIGMVDIFDRAENQGPGDELFADGSSSPLWVAAPDGRVGRRRIRLVRVAVAAAVVILVLVGGVAWLSSGDPDHDVIDQPTTTVVTPSPPGAIGLLGPGAWSLAATFVDPAVSQSLLSSNADELRTWPGVLEVVEVSDRSAWVELTGLDSDCGEGDVVAPCGIGIAALIVNSWTAQAVLRLEAEFGMDAIVPEDVPVAFWEGYLAAALRDASPVPLQFDPASLGVNLPLSGPFVNVSGETCGRSCDVRVDLEADGSLFQAGLEFSDGGLIFDVGPGLGGTGFSVSDMLITGGGEGGVLADFNGAIDDRRIYSLAGLPLNGAVVTFELADGTGVWQRPLAGMALILDQPESAQAFADELPPVPRPFVLLNSDGAEILRIRDTDGRPVVAYSQIDVTAMSETQESKIGPQSIPSADGQIAFVTETEEENLDIFSMGADGTGLTRLTTDPSMDTDPSWSPDGTQVAFVSNRDGSGDISSTDIYVMDANSRITRLTDDPGEDSEPAWSPDGTQIAFVSSRGGQGREVYVMDTDGTNVTQLTDSSDGPVGPSWSPDGTRIVYASVDGEPFTLFVMEADGSNVSRLIDGPDPNTQPDWYFQPDWSPDGSRIVFSGTTFGDLSVTHIFVIDADGTNLTQLTRGTTTRRQPKWSPDGTRILFLQWDDLSNSRDFYMIDASGNNITRLTASATLIDHAAWSK